MSSLLFAVLLLAVGLERLAELVLSKRHLAWSLARGGREFGAGHYPVMVSLHAAFLLGAMVEVVAAHRPFIGLLGWPMLTVVLLAQLLRWWSIRSLGPHWNTKVVVVPGMALIASGPYRWLRHPNYVAVVAEGVALPLVHTAWVTAVLFTALNGWLLTVRIRTEDAALVTAVAP